MRAFFKMLFTPGSPKVDVFNPDHSFRVSGINRWRLSDHISRIPGVVLTRKPRVLASGAKPHAEFKFRDIAFQMDDGGDTGGDGLWISPKDGLPHPIELREIREGIEKSFINEPSKSSNG